MIRRRVGHAVNQRDGGRFGLGIGDDEHVGGVSAGMTPICNPSVHVKTINQYIPHGKTSRLRNWRNNFANRALVYLIWPRTIRSGLGHQPHQSRPRVASFFHDTKINSSKRTADENLRAEPCQSLRRTISLPLEICPVPDTPLTLSRAFHDSSDQYITRGFKPGFGSQGEIAHRDDRKFIHYPMGSIGYHPISVLMPSRILIL